MYLQNIVSTKKKLEIFSSSADLPGRGRLAPNLIVYPLYAYTALGCSTLFPPRPQRSKWLHVAVGIGMLVGLEREWSSGKDVGVRTFSIVSLLGMLASLAGRDFIIAGLVGIFLS